MGEKRKGFLLKLYVIICNNFWESCDFYGYSFVFERRYYFKYFLLKRKYDKLGEKRVLGFEVDKLLIYVLKYKFYKISGERSIKCFFTKNVVSSVFRSYIIIYMREFCDREDFEL